MLSNAQLYAEIRESDQRLNSIVNERGPQSENKLKLRFERASGLYLVFYDLSGEQISLQFRDSLQDKQAFINQLQPGAAYLVTFSSVQERSQLPYKRTRSLDQLPQERVEADRRAIIYGRLIKMVLLRLDDIRH